MSSVATTAQPAFRIAAIWSPSYSSWYAPASCFENAHCGPSPSVPKWNDTTGRLPAPVHGAVGTATVPETATARPRRSVEAYWTCQAFIAMPPGTAGRVTDRQASTVPGDPVTVAGGV